MKTVKLKSMTEFILDMDFMTTNEFCTKYNVSLPGFTGEVKSSAAQFLKIDAIKHRLFVAYAKLLNSPIKEDMLKDIADGKTLFPYFEKSSSKRAMEIGTVNSFDNFGEDKFSLCIFKEKTDEHASCWHTYYHLKKVGDLVRCDIQMNETELRKILQI